MAVRPLEFPNVRCRLDRERPSCADSSPQWVSPKSSSFQAYTQGLLGSLEIHTGVEAWDPYVPAFCGGCFGNWIASEAYL